MIVFKNCQVLLRFFFGQFAQPPPFSFRSSLFQLIQPPCRVSLIPVQSQIWWLEAQKTVLMFTTITTCNAFLLELNFPYPCSNCVAKSRVCIMDGGHDDTCLPWGNPNINRVPTIDLDCFGCNWHCLHFVAILLCGLDACGK